LPRGSISFGQITGASWLKQKAHIAYEAVIKNVTLTTSNWIGLSRWRNELEEAEQQLVRLMACADNVVEVHLRHTPLRRTSLVGDGDETVQVSWATRSAFSAFGIISSHF